ncbi:MAG: 3-phosphoglycerate dehydrogenase [Burkholderiaceae bacterium]|nr:3-phosphoglycerate dehydrogenase [Burkholderiaceae bacterium]
MKILITEFMDAAAVQSLRERCPRQEVVYDAALVDDPARIDAALGETVALVVRNRTRVAAGLIARAPRLLVVGRLGVGLDNIELDACAARDIAVFPATGANADAVAEYVVAAVMTLLRGAFTASHEVVAGAWPRARLSAGREVAGKTLGLVGFGDIGRRSARLAQALGMHTVAHDPMLGPGDPCWTRTATGPRTLDALVAQADAISLHVPLLASTRNLFDARRIAAMKRGAVLVNTARGGVLDEHALAGALREGHLGGAALDVFEHEPLGEQAHWHGLGNLILTPHVAGVTVESNERVSALIADRVAGHLAKHDAGTGR